MPIAYPHAGSGGRRPAPSRFDNCETTPGGYHRQARAADPLKTEERQRW